MNCEYACENGENSHLIQFFMNRCVVLFGFFSTFFKISITTTNWEDVCQNSFSSDLWILWSSFQMQCFSFIFSIISSRHLRWQICAPEHSNPAFYGSLTISARVGIFGCFLKLHLQKLIRLILLIKFFFFFNETMFTSHSKMFENICGPNGCELSANMISHLMIFLGI